MRYKHVKARKIPFTNRRHDVLKYTIMSLMQWASEYWHWYCDTLNRTSNLSAVRNMAKKMNGVVPQQNIVSIHCVQKKTHSHFLSYLHGLFVDLNKNCSEYTQELIDSDNVKIRYSLRPMTSLWRHICLANVGVSLQYAISRDPKDIIFASTGYLLVHRRGCIVYYVVEFKTIISNIKQIFIHKPD